LSHQNPQLDHCAFIEVEVVGIPIFSSRINVEGQNIAGIPRTAPPLGAAATSLPWYLCDRQRPEDMQSLGQLMLDRMECPEMGLRK